MKSLKQWHVIVLFVGVFTLLFALNGLKTIDMKLQDRLFQQQQSVDARIAIIAIDDASLQQIGQWPWARDVHAELVEKLASGNAAVVGFDITFPLPSTNTADDTRFIEAVEEAGNVVLARYGVFGQYAEKGILQAQELSEPFPQLKESAAALGHLNTMPEQDGIVRQSLYQFTYEQQVIPSFSAAIADLYAQKMNVTLAKPNEALNAYDQFPIAYSGKPGAYEIIPYARVLAGDIEPSYFENRIVLVGPYTVGIKDDFLTPMHRSQHMYGVEIHANIIQQMLAGNYKQTLGWPAFLIAMAVTAGVLFIVSRLGPLMSGITLLAYGVGYCLVAKWLYGQGFMMSVAYILGLLIFAYISSVIVQYILEQTERKRITSIFGRYVAPQVVNEILASGEDGLQLGGSRQYVTVMFVDIRGFTPLSESVEPEEIVGILNEYLNLTASCIFDHGGTLDKFIGDATMAIYNAPLALDNHELQAVKTAFQMKQGAVELEKRLFERYGKSVQFGIGIHCGPAVVGNIGSANHMDYTAIGDTVNTAARLESNAKAGQILLSEALYERVKNDVTVKSLGIIQVKGKAEGISIYELEGLT